MAFKMCVMSVISHTMSRPAFFTLQEQGEISLGAGQRCDACAKLVANTRQSNHTSRHTSGRPCSLIFRAAPHFVPATSSQRSTLPYLSFALRRTACPPGVHHRSRFLSAARLSPIYLSRRLRSCTCSLLLSLCSSHIHCSLCHGVPVHRVCKQTTLDKFLPYVCGRLRNSRRVSWERGPDRIIPWYRVTSC